MWGARKNKEEYMQLIEDVMNYRVASRNKVSWKRVAEMHLKERIITNPEAHEEYKAAREKSRAQTNTRKRMVKAAEFQRALLP